MMSTSPQHFGKLLEEGIKSVANRQGRKLKDVYPDVGETLAVSGETVRNWFSNRSPSPTLQHEDIVNLSDWCMKQGRLNTQWLTEFL